jgi:hypothetical protein
MKKGRIQLGRPFSISLEPTDEFLPPTRPSPVDITNPSVLILRQRQIPSIRTGSKAPLSINPEQTPGFRLGKVEGLIF